MRPPPELSYSQHLIDGWPTRLAFLKAWCEPGSRAVDVGCCYGAYALPLAAIAAHVDAIDLNKDFLDVLSSYATDLNIQNITATCADFIDWSRGKEGLYDFCLCTGTLMNLRGSRRRAFLTALRRVLKDDGRLLLDFYTPSYLLYRVVIQKLPLRHKARSLGCLLLRRSYLTAKTFEHEATEIGFKVTAYGSEINYPDSPYYLCRVLEGFNLSTPLGNYFQPYVLTLAK